MADHEHYTPQQIIDALVHTRGMKFMAAKQLGCHHDTITNYMNRYPAVKAVAESCRGEFVDIMELKLFQAVQNGEPWAITLGLKNLGKDRGYTERHEVTGADGGPLDVRAIPVDERRGRIKALIAKSNGHYDAQC